MADLAIDSTAHASSETPAQSGHHALIATSETVVYFFYLNATDSDLQYKKSTNAGVSFGSVVTITAKTEGVQGFACWYDKWTSGGSGTKIHITYWDSDDGDQVYNSLDTNGDSIGGEVTIVDTNEEPIAQMYSCIAKARGGNIYVVYAHSATTKGFYRSTDNGASWGTARADPVEADIDDFYKMVLLPANAADANDMWLVYGDQSANALTVKTYDDSGNSWAESSSASATIVFSSTTNYYKQVHAAIRHSDGHAIIVLATHVDNAAGDLMVFDWDGSSFTTKTNIITNGDDWMCPVVCIDQNTNDIYVGYLGQADGGQTWTATVSAHYQKSTDGGSTWSGETSYDEGAADDYRVLHTCPSTPGAANGLFIMVWFDDDDNDWWTNAVNAVDLLAGEDIDVSDSLNVAVSESATVIEFATPTDSLAVAATEGTTVLLEETTRTDSLAAALTETSATQDGTTLNLAIADTNDDGWAADNGVGTGFLPTDTLINVGTHSGQSGATQIWGRFTGVSGLAYATVISAIYRPKYKTKSGTPLTNVHLEKAAAPAQPTSATDLSGRTLTTAITAVDNPTGLSDGDRMAIDVTAQLQEIIDAGHDPSAIQVVWVDDGSAAGFVFIQIYDYSNSPSDAAQLDIVYVSNALTVSDSLAVALNEQVAIAEEAAVSDSLGVAVTEATALADDITASDSLALAVSETVAITEEVTATDSLALAITEAHTTEEATDRTESLALAVTDMAAILEVAEVTDTLDLAVSEDAAMADVVNLTDSLVLDLSETADALEVVDATDTLALAVGEAHVTDEESTVSDNAELTITDAAAVLEAATVTDTGAVALDEEQATLEAATVADTLELAATDASEISDTENEEQVSDTDSLVLALTEAAEVFDTADLTDSLIVAVTETQASVDAGAATDTLGVDVSESTALFEDALAADAADIAASEAVALLESGAVSDALALNVSDASEVDDLTNQEDIDEADTLAIGVTETVSVLEVAAVSDLLEQAVAEMVAIAEAAFRTDSLALNLTDSLTGADTVTASDILRPAVSEVVLAQDAIVLSDALVLALSEASLSTDLEALTVSDLLSLQLVDAQVMTEIDALVSTIRLIGRRRASVAITAKVGAGVGLQGRERATLLLQGKHDETVEV